MGSSSCEPCLQLHPQEGVELCSSILGKYVTDQRGIEISNQSQNAELLHRNYTPSAEHTKTRTEQVRETSTVTKTSTQLTGRSHSGASLKSLCTRLSWLISRLLPPCTATTTLYPQLYACQSQFYEVSSTLTVTETAITTAATYLVVGTDVITTTLTTETSTTSYSSTGSTQDVYTTVDVSSTETDTSTVIVSDTSTSYTTNTYTITDSETTTATTTDLVTVTVRVLQTMIVSRLISADQSFDHCGIYRHDGIAHNYQHY